MDTHAIVTDTNAIVADISRNVTLAVQAGSNGQNVSVSTGLYSPTTER